MKQPLALLVALAFMAACSAPQSEAPADEPAAPVKATTDIEATVFLTENKAAPEGAADTKGDGVLRDANNRPFHYALLGEKLPDFTAPTADGGTFESATLDRWTVIDVWGAWCGDCVRDAPYADALQRAIAQDPDLDFLTIHVPASATRATPEEMFGKYGSLEAYFGAMGFTLPTVLDMDGSLRETLKIGWTPTYLLISPDRVVRGFRTDLSIDQDQPVKTFLQNVAEVRREVRDLPASDPSDIE